MQSSMTISNIMEINPLTTNAPNLLRKSTDCFLYDGNIGCLGVDNFYYIEGNIGR